MGACPLDCPDACSWVMTVEPDAQGVERAVKVRGNREHPFTRGGLCKKVNPWLTYAADPGRLHYPMRRVGPKGSGAQFERITWDVALAEIAERLLDARQRFGGESIWPFTGTGHMGWIQGASAGAGARLFHALGASHHSVSICSVSGHHGLGYSTGIGVTFDPEQVEQAGLVLLWGTNTRVANQHFWPFVQRAQRNGVPVVVVDPARTRTAAAADLHLALKPGSDGALAMGLGRALRDRGACDEAFLAERTLGAEEFLASLDAWDRAATLEATGVDPDGFDQLVELLIDCGPLAIKLGQGMQRHAHGGQAARVVSTLPALTGSYGQVGGGLLYSTSPAYELAVDRRERPDLRPGPVRSLAMTNLGRVLTEVNDPPVAVLMVSGANPLVSNPQVELVREGLARPDLFTVVTELFHTETVDYADIVLPSAMQHEQIDVTESFAHLYLNWNEPAVAPPGECLSSTEMHRRLATALDLDVAALQASDLELVADLLDTEAYREAGITVERLRAEGFVRVPAADRFTPMSGPFPTPSGLFEFVSERAERDGHGRLPTALPQRERAAGSGSYVLVARGSEAHVNSVFAGTEHVRARVGEPTLRVAPEDAARDGLASGDRVRVHNERGAFEAVIEVSEEARPGVATTEKGWWRQGLNATVREVDSDMGRGAVFHDNEVSITHIERAGVK